MEGGGGSGGRERCRECQRVWVDERNFEFSCPLVGVGMSLFPGTASSSLNNCAERLHFHVLSVTCVFTVRYFTNLINLNFILQKCLEVLQKEVRQTLKAAFAESKELKTQWRSYFLFCKFYGLKAIPATVEILCLYGQFLGRSFESVESVRNYISGVKTTSGVNLPSEDSYQLTLVLRGIARSNPICLKRPCW